MKKIFLLFILLSSFIFSAIDECKTDVYFGNGILTKKESAIHNAGILRKAIKQETSLDYYNKHIGKVDYAYNRTDGFAMDILESLVQKLDGTFISAADRTNILMTIERIGGLLTEDAHTSDLTKQVEKYKDSIKEGHKVLVVAHSQGNLFASEAYKKLGTESKNGWMQNYFQAVGIASPGHWSIKDEISISWDNDMVAHLGLYGSALIK